uniref:Uncharacterized protein n=1 Tax=Physcomitrium patens TaxID=3218 RepID=A0A2K1J459_PHYPA|nr:hypothetical protein PHYPA_022168 [Physcomitrium patens]
MVESSPKNKARGVLTKHSLGPNLLWGAIPKLCSFY